jgi:tetratricopeptide (TPR) repeat protein
MANSLMQKIWSIGMLAMALAVPMWVNAQGGFTARDRALLPEYCKYTPGERLRAGTPGGNAQSEIERWSRIMGPPFSGLHHYCWGLMATNKAMVARTRQQRLHLLETSIREFDYVLQRATRDFVLLPEILTKKGHNLVRLDDAARAIPELQRAIEVKPDYWPPYTVLSDYFRDVGDTAKARQWLERGLAVAPDVTALKRRLAELDGVNTKRKLARDSTARTSKSAEAAVEKESGD